MTPCTHPGCRRRCMPPHTLCVAHRPPPPPRLRQRDPEREREYDRRRAERRKRSGIAPGWELA